MVPINVEACGLAVTVVVVAVDASWTWFAFSSGEDIMWGKREAKRLQSSVLIYVAVLGTSQGYP